MIKEKWYIRILKLLGIVKREDKNQRELKTRMCVEAQDVCNKNCETCAWNV